MTGLGLGVGALLVIEPYSTPAAVVVGLALFLAGFEFDYRRGV